MRSSCRIPVLWVLAAIALVATVALVACSGADDTFGGGAQMRVLITDAPADSIESAVVTISRVYLQPDDDAEDRAAVDLLPASAAPQTYDLLDLRNGVEAVLAEAAVPPGKYGQLRLVVESATVTLVPGLTFDDGTSTRDLQVPSGMQSGIKVRLDDPIVAEDDTLTIVVVDFDVNDNFVLQGNPGTPAGIHGVSFTPSVHEKRRDELPAP